MSLPMEDFEDALVSICAEKAGVNCIVSRDEKYLQSSSPVKVVALKDFLALSPAGHAE
ncbi:MAG: PIN domain-containing protein [Actinomycetia bacterium]|nr:PIN domain-containing protein [Actinomycetes bacterium]